MDVFHAQHFDEGGVPFSASSDHNSAAAAEAPAILEVEDPVEERGLRPAAMRLARDGAVNAFNQNFERMMELNCKLGTST